MSKYGTIVIKIGSSTLTTKEGKLDIANLTRLASEMAEQLKDNGKKIVITTSGAIVTGAEKLGLRGKLKSIPEKQAAAAVGQSALMRQYEKAFEIFGLPVAQVLLTREEVSDEQKRINAYHTLKTLLELNVVPVVNENDTVAVEEIKVGDNDRLSAYVAELIKADLLILLSDIDGFYLKSQSDIPFKVEEITEITDEIRAAAGHPSTQLGTGGMITKLQAVEICSPAGIAVVIADGREKGALSKILAGEKVGTIFHPQGAKHKGGRV
jgi:glutamate 5-kinase